MLLFAVIALLALQLSLIADKKKTFEVKQP